MHIPNDKWFICHLDSVSGNYKYEKVISKDNYNKNYSPIKIDKNEDIIKNDLLFIQKVIK